MAEEEAGGGQEKTEEPTQQKQDKAREEGQVPRSKELNTLAILVAGCLGLILSGPGFYEAGLRIARANFAFDVQLLRQTGWIPGHLGDVTGTVVVAMLPFFALVVGAAFAGPVVLGGMLFSAKSIEPKLSRMDPIKGIGRMFSLNALVELAKAILKLLTVAAVATGTLYLATNQLHRLGMRALEPAIVDAAVLIVVSFLFMSLAMVLIAIVDVPFQIFQHADKLKMTRQEVKEEMKNTEGRPEVKSRVRQLQREMSQKRMMSAVPDADVVITNPSHFAVALRYDPVNMLSPIVVAKGVDQVAAMIRQVAGANNITQIRFPLLARALYFTTELDDAIPEGLYLAVAQVLAYVFQLRQHQQHQGPRPRPLSKVKIPPEFADIARRQRPA